MATITFDPQTRIATIASPTDVITVQEVYDKSRAYENTFAQMSQDLWVVAVGKDQMTLTTALVVSLFMLNNSRVAFEDRAGPSLEVMQTQGGNFVGRVADKDSAINHPIAPTANTHATIDQASTGLAVTDTSIASDITQIQTDVAAMEVVLTKVDDQQDGEHTTSQVAGKLIIRNTVALRRWEALIWEDEAQTIPYQGQGLESIGQLVEVAYS